MYMPGWLVKWFIGTVSPWVHRKIVQMLGEQFTDGSVYRQRMAANSLLYGTITARVQEFMKNAPAVDYSDEAHVWERQWQAELREIQIRKFRCVRGLHWVVLVLLLDRSV